MAHGLGIGAAWSGPPTGAVSCLGDLCLTPLVGSVGLRRFIGFLRVTQRLCNREMARFSHCWSVCRSVCVWGERERRESPTCWHSPRMSSARGPIRVPHTVVPKLSSHHLLPVRVSVREDLGLEVSTPAGDCVPGSAPRDSVPASGFLQCPPRLSGEVQPAACLPGLKLTPSQ